MAPTTSHVRNAKAAVTPRAQRSVKLKRVSLLVPDTRSAAFVQQAKRESLALRRSPHADDDQAFVDALSAWDAE